MGNHQSSVRLAISAMADMMRVTKQQMLELRKDSLRYASGTPGEDLTITRKNFHSAMAHIALDELDVDVFDQLYTMWDKTGECKVNVVLFLSGTSPLASATDVASKLLFAMEMYDVKKTGIMRRADMIKILGGINATASYFGDAVITPQQIEIVVEEAFQTKQEIYYLEYIDRLATHPSILQFVNGAGTMRYGTGKTHSQNH